MELEKRNYIEGGPYRGGGVVERRKVAHLGEGCCKNYGNLWKISCEDTKFPIGNSVNVHLVTKTVERGIS